MTSNLIPLRITWALIRSRKTLDHPGPCWDSRDLIIYYEIQIFLPIKAKEIAMTCCLKRNLYISLNLRRGALWYHPGILSLADRIAVSHSSSYVNQYFVS